MIELRSPDGQAQAVILPEHGGRLHQVQVTVSGRKEPLLWSPEDPAEYQAQPTRGGAFPMAPWPNRVAQGRFTWRGREYRLPTDGKPHATHGRVLQHPWDVVGATGTTCDLRCDFDDGWPWSGYAEQRFEIGDGWLRMELAVHATKEAFPAGCGWHPWFRRDVAGAGEVRVRVPARERYVLVENLPTGEVVPVAGHFDLRDGPPLGERRLDDCYRGLFAPIEVDWGRLRLAIEAECAEPHVQVFTPDYAFCVEPQTCVADAFNLAERGVHETGMAIAEPGKPVAIRSIWRWEPK